MSGFYNKELENAYDYFMFLNENKFFEDKEDVERLEKILSEWHIPYFEKEYEIGFTLYWESSLGHIECKRDGQKARLKDHIPTTLKKGVQFLSDFFFSIADARKRSKG